jgi:predicted NUDIX family phosphoesterase
MKIFCIKTECLPGEWAGESGALFAPFFSCIHEADAAWIERGDAEKDENYRQIIPYVLLKKASGEFLCYPRHGSEERLHGLYSCGVGGHIDVCDKKNTMRETVYAGMMRELSEELENFDETFIKMEYKGVINETKSAVGRVHLGLVFLAECAEGYEPKAASELAGSFWASKEMISALNMEEWSKLALHLV